MRCIENVISIEFDIMKKLIRDPLLHEVVANIDSWPKISIWAQTKNVGRRLILKNNDVFYPRLFSQGF